YSDTTTVGWFAERCADLVWNCVDQWGGERVRDWYWCIGSGANSDWISPGLTFDHYRGIYLRAAESILRWLPPAEGRKPLIGGPGIDTFQPFWFDWIWRFVRELHNGLCGVATWQQYGDWRVPGEWGAPVDEARYRALLMHRISEYGDRAQTIARVLGGRRIFSLCSRVNAHAHHERSVASGFNQTLFGAVHYVAALLQFMREAADGEMFWMGTDPHGSYGLWDHAGDVTPAFHAKRLCTQYIRYGDTLVFPGGRPDQPLDAVIARRGDGRQSLILVHRSQRPMRYLLTEVAGDAAQYDAVVKIDGNSPSEGRIARCDGEVRFDGYGIAVASTHLVSGEGSGMRSEE